MDILKIQSRVWITAALLLLVLAGGYLRFYNLSGQSYWMDEGYTVNAVLAIEEHGSTVLDSGSNYSCALYCYPTSAIAEYLGNNAFSYRLLAAIAGILLVTVIFFIGQAMFGSWVGLGTAFLTSFSYFQIAWSRQARWYTLFELFFWLALFFFYQSFYAKSRRWLWIFLTAAFTLLAAFTHGLGYLLPFIFLGWFLIDRWFIQKKFRVGEFFAGIAALLAVGAGFEYFKLVPQVHFFYELPYYLSFYLRNYWLLITLAIATVVLTGEKHKKATWYLSFAILAYLLPLSFFTGIVHYRYLFHLTPAIFLLASLGVAKVWALLPTQSKYVKIGVVLLLGVLFFALNEGVWVPTTNYFLESDDPASLPARPYYAYTPQPDWDAAYAYVLAHQQPSDIVISSMPQFNKIFLGEAAYWIKYDYLGFDTASDRVVNGKEMYVGAQAVDGLPALILLTQNQHGYFIFDYMAADGRIPDDVLAYVRTNFTQVLSEETNSYSKVWVYKF